MVVVLPYRQDGLKYSCFRKQNSPPVSGGAFLYLYIMFKVQLVQQLNEPQVREVASNLRNLDRHHERT